MTTTPRDPHDDFLPEDWNAELPPGIGADFIASTFEKVNADQAEIAAEAARVDDYQFPEGFLDHFRTPEPSAEFVTETAARASAAMQASETEAWSELLDTYEAPRASSDFVTRTFDALRIERAPLRLVRDGETPVLSISQRFGWAAAAAILVSIALAFALSSGGENGSSRQPLTAAVIAQIETTADFSPTPIGTEFVRDEDDAAGDLHFEAADGLLFLAAEASR